VLDDNKGNAAGFRNIPQELFLSFQSASRGTDTNNGKIGALADYYRTVELGLGACLRESGPAALDCRLTSIALARYLRRPNPNRSELFKMLG